VQGVQHRISYALGAHTARAQALGGITCSRDRINGSVATRGVDFAVEALT
jgi:hypothetical protein